MVRGALQRGLVEQRDAPAGACDRALLLQLPQHPVDVHRGQPGRVTDLFLRPPLRREAYRAGFGTLYTAAYRPARGEVTYLWPGTAWRRHFEDGQDGIRAWVNEM